METGLAGEGKGGIKMITPQAGDLWKCSYVHESSPAEPGPDDFPQSDNLIKNGSYSATVLHNYWYMHDSPRSWTNRWNRKWWERYKNFIFRFIGYKMIMVTNSGDETKVPDDIENGKNGWELVYRPNWIKLIQNDWPLNNERSFVSLVEE